MIFETNKGMEINLDEASDAAIPGFKKTKGSRPNYTNKPEKKKRLISRFFSDMARFGMRYEDDVISNMRAIPADKSLLSDSEKQLNQDLFVAAASNWKTKTNADKSIYEKDWNAKVMTLRKLSLQPELEDILDTMTNECVVYDSDFTYFITPFIENAEINDFKKETQDNIQKSLSRYFRVFYKMFNWKYTAWADFKRFLIDGILCWEIVWDSLEKPTKIIGFVPLDPGTITRKFSNNKYYWVQFKGIQGRERQLLDSQIIYIAFNDGNYNERTSYLERLIRPYNIYRIVEEAQLIWTITNSSYKMKFTIPVKGMNKALGMQTLASAMNSYREDIKFNSDDGTLNINGQSNMPFSKEYWFPEGDSGTPTIESIASDGPNMNDNDQLKYFKNQLYKISKIPLNRFDIDNDPGWTSDPTSTARAEIDFGRYVRRLRNQFSQIMIKPLQLQLACDYPELKDNKYLLQAISLRWGSYNLFEEMMEIDLMQKKIDFVTSTKESLVDMDGNGNDVKWFSSKFLAQKYLKLPDADLKLNEKLKKIEAEEMHMAGGDNAAAQMNLASEDDITPDILEKLRSDLNKKKRNIKKQVQHKEEDHCDDEE